MRSMRWMMRFAILGALMYGVKWLYDNYIAPARQPFTHQSTTHPTRRIDTEALPRDARRQEPVVVQELLSASQGSE